MARQSVKERNARNAKFQALAVAIRNSANPDTQSLARSYGLSFEDVERTIRSIRA